MLTPQQLASIEAALSAERLTGYVTAAGGDKQEALKLYEWDTRMAGALLMCLSKFEVAFRNAVDAQLSAMAAPVDWFDAYDHILQEPARDAIQLARGRVCRGRYGVTHGRMVAELNLGFWRYLVTTHYARTLWVPGLSRAFPHAGQPLSKISRSVSKVYNLRNRVAHHEPVHRQDIAGVDREMHAILSWICPDTATWAQRHCLVSKLVGARPDAHSQRADPTRTRPPN